MPIEAAIDRLAVPEPLAAEVAPATDAAGSDANETPAADATPPVAHAESAH